MARKAADPVVDETVEEIDMSLLTEAPDDWEFETVREESATRIDFTDLGDCVILQYVGTQHIEREPDKDGKDQSFDLFMWTGRDGLPYSVNTSWSLVEAQENDMLTPGDWYRLTYIKDVKTARGLNPMKDIKVEKKKN